RVAGVAAQGADLHAGEVAAVQVDGGVAVLRDVGAGVDQGVAGGGILGRREHGGGDGGLGDAGALPGNRFGPAAGPLLVLDANVVKSGAEHDRAAALDRAVAAVGEGDELPVDEDAAAVVAGGEEPVRPGDPDVDLAGPLDGESFPVGVVGGEHAHGAAGGPIGGVEGAAVEVGVDDDRERIAEVLGADDVDGIRVVHVAARETGGAGGAG